jgi:N-acetylmuramoyl-L-alanine amidase
MIASLIWISFHQEKHPAVYRESKPAQPQTSKPFAVVVLDPGHGGEDSGAMCGGVMEKDLTLDIARRVDRLLDSEGVATLMTRVGDSYVSLADRAAFGNRANRKHFYQYSFQRRQQTGRERRGNLLCCASDQLRLYFRFVAAVFLAAAVQFAQARKPKSCRFHSGSTCGADPLHRPRDAS